MAVFWHISRKSAPSLPPPPSDPTQDPQALATGWVLNDLCTSADMVQPAIALERAEQWRSALSLPPVPVPDLDQEAAFAQSLLEQLDAYFAAMFERCSRAPDSLFGGDRATTPAELAAAVAARINAGEPVTDPLESFVMYTAGLGGFQ